MSGWKLCEYVVGILIPLVVFSVVDRPRRSSGSVEGGEPSGVSPRSPLSDLGQHAPPWGGEKPEAVPTCLGWKASNNLDGSEAGRTLSKHKG